MLRRQYRHQMFEPNRLDIDRGVHSPRRMQEAEVELRGADRLNPLVAVDVFQEYFNVRIGTAKAVDGVWDHANGGDPRKPEPDASDLASTCTLCSADSVVSVVQDDTNVLQKNTAGRGERDRSFRTYEKLDT